MKQDKVTSLLKYLENDKVSSKLCGVRNEQIQGDTAIAEIRGDSFPNGLKFIFVKENGEWKMTNRSPEIEALRKSSPNSFANRVTKKNERPTGDNVGDPKTNGRAAYTPVYFYEFTRPGFTYERVLIEHDEAGKGSISFSKDGFDEMMTDPILLAPVTMGNLTTVLTALNFLASNDNYQTESDHSNMGNVTITVKKDGKERMAKYNWTENKQAKFLMDEYRRIANEYTWKFEIGIARQNQPLQTPRLMTTLDDYISRNEISDPPHLVTMLTELSTDERLPLIARDHAAKIVKQIEKAKK